MTILVPGSAGFIGHAVAIKLLARGEKVVGLDNLDPYYDVNLKKARLALIQDNPNFTDARIDLANREQVEQLFETVKPTRVINLAAQAGVRNSIENPRAYMQSNLVGFLNILEGCRAVNVRHLVYASSSSVYGTNTKLPFSVHDPVDHPISLYAASKRGGELMAHAYSHLFNMPATGLRFFTVYGPWGRPDMALFKFAKAMIEGKPIDIYNEGKMSRDFTYIDDIVDGVVKVLDAPSGPIALDEGESPDPASSHTAPFRVFNIGNNKPIELMAYVKLLEDSLGIKAKPNFMPMQPGDAKATQADVKSLIDHVGYAPKTSVDQGVARFVEWYKEYYGV